MLSPPLIAQSVPDSRLSAYEIPFGQCLPAGLDKGTRPPAVNHWRASKPWSPGIDGPAWIVVV
jgi:hypothetical protein